jgi:uncharacterized lipoprotein YmbA
MGGRFAALLLLAATACLGSEPARFYTLDSTARSDGAPAEHVAVLVSPVTIPAAVDRPQLVLSVSANRVEIDEFERWAAPLGDSIARVIAADLSTLLGTPDVASAPLANFAPGYRVSIAVQRFESAPGQHALVDALWTVRKTSGGAPRSGRSIAQEPVSDASVGALAAAHSRALTTVSADIAAAIRAD